MGNAVKLADIWASIIYNAKAYGAKGDGVTDDTTKIQAAINAAQTAGGGKVFLPPGTYKTTSKIIISTTCIIEGSGRGFTIILYQGGDGDAFEIDANYCEINNIMIKRTGSPLSGAGIKVTNASLLCTFDNITVTGFFYGMDFTSAASWNLSDSYLFNNLQYEVYIRNTSAGDSGDQVIQGCTFDSSINGAAAIRHESGGGVKIYGNKILRHQIGYDLQVGDAVATSIALITGNSIEMQTVRHIRLGRLGTTGTYSMIDISSNQHSYVTSITEGYLINSGVDTINIVGNITGGYASAPYVNIAGGSDINVDGNQISNWQTGVKIAATINGVNVGTNAFKSVANPIEDNTTPAPAVTQAPNIFHSYMKRVIAVTSTTTYTNLFQIDMQSFRACTVELTVEGVVAGLSAVGRQIKQVIVRNSGSCTETSVFDVNAGAVVDIQFDNATISGSTIIGIRRNAAGGGTQVDGTVTLKISGHVQVVNIL